LAGAHVLIRRHIGC